MGRRLVDRIVNVIFVLMDDCPPDVTTGMPFLANHADVIKFPNSFLHTPICGPSRAAFWTGMYAERSGITTNYGTESLLRHRNLMQQLHAAGVYTAASGKFIHGYVGGWPGYSDVFVPRWIDRAALMDGQSQDDDGIGYYDYTLVEKAVDGTQTAVAYGSDEADYCTDVLNTFATDVIAAAPEPFFCQVSHFGPHPVQGPGPGSVTAAPRHVGIYAEEPIIHRPGFNEADVSDKPAWVQALPALTELEETQHDNLHRQAWAAARSIDEGLEGIFDALDARDPTLRYRTVIIVMADNGWNLGEHRLQSNNLTGSKATPYQEAILGNLHIFWPGVAGRIESAMVFNLDIFPTVLAVFGLTPTHVPNGMNLAPLLDGTGPAANWRRHMYLHQENQGPAFPAPTWSTVIEADEDSVPVWKFTAYSTGETELYDLATDPGELVNLATTNTTKAAAMADALTALRPTA